MEISHPPSMNQDQFYLIKHNFHDPAKIIQRHGRKADQSFCGWRAGVVIMGTPRFGSPSGMRARTTVKLPS